MRVDEHAGMAPGGVSGPLRAALAASIALHAAVLAGLPDLWTYSEQAVAAPLIARLEPAAPPGDDAAPARAAVAASEPEKKARREAARPKPELPAPSTSSSITEMVTAAAAPQVEEASAKEPVTLAAAPASSPAATSGAEPALPSGSSKVAPRVGDDARDLGSVAHYRLALMGTAKQYKLYPAHAIERGWEGRVDVRLVIGADGELTLALVKRSSGHELLDRHAVTMMKKATSLTPIPPALRDREFAVEVPVLFELKSEG